MRALRQSRGSVILIVLVTLLFTSFALILFVEQASTDLLVTSRDVIARRLRRDAYSALEASLGTINDFRLADSALHSPAEGWRDPLGFSGWQPREGTTAEVSVEDESGKISLSHVDAATLTNLFKAWNFSESDADRLTDALLGWMRRDYVPTSALSPNYDQSSLPFAAPERPMRSFSELAAVDFVRDTFFDQQGRPNELWYRFTATFSIFNFQQVNLNAASADVLTALGFSDPTQYQRIQEFLNGTGPYQNQGPQWLTSAAQAASLLGTPRLPSGLGSQVRALRVNITVREGRNEFRLSAVVAPAGGASIVKTTATSSRSTASGSTASAQTGPAVAQPTAPPQLNYPFTLLEIKENGEISPSAPPAPPAPDAPSA